MGIFVKNIGLGCAVNVKLPGKNEDIFKSLNKVFSDIPRNLSMNGESLFVTYHKNAVSGVVINKTTSSEITYDDSQGNTYKTILNNQEFRFSIVKLKSVWDKIFNLVSI